MDVSPQILTSARFWEGDHDITKSVEGNETSQEDIDKNNVKDISRVRRVGVFYFGTGRVGYLQKRSVTGTGRDG